MKRFIRILPFFLFIFLIDRFMFLPGRMDEIWQYEYGAFVGETIAFDNIDIVNNFEVSVSKSMKFDSFYLVGCYFGNLYLLKKETLQLTKYVELEELSF